MRVLPVAALGERCFIIATSLQGWRLPRLQQDGKGARSHHLCAGSASRLALPSALSAACSIDPMGPGDAQRATLCRPVFHPLRAFLPPASASTTPAARLDGARALFGQRRCESRGRSRLLRRERSLLGINGGHPGSPPTLEAWELRAVTSHRPWPVESAPACIQSLHLRWVSDRTAD